MNRHRLAGLGPDLQQLGLHELARLRVQRRERLIHQQHGRVRRQRPGQIHALLHAAGKLRRIVPFEAAQAHQLDEVFGALAPWWLCRSASAVPSRSGRCRRWSATAAGWNAGTPRRGRCPARGPCLPVNRRPSLLHTAAGPATMFSSEVLPQPLGPTMAMNSPSATESETSISASDFACPRVRASIAWRRGSTSSLTTL